MWVFFSNLKNNKNKPWNDINLLRCSLRASRPALIFSCLSVLPPLSYLCLYPCTFPLSSLCLFSSRLSFLFWLPLSLHCSSFPFPPFIFVSAAVWCCNPCGVSSGQSYPPAQYESGLQQRGQQREQQGHQPRTLLHAPWWVAVVDGIPRRDY